MNIPRPRKLPLANLPTPFRRLISAGTGPWTQNVWLKSDDQSGLVLSGNKVRKLEYLLAEAQDRQATRIISCGGIQSNHCRAVAAACARLNLHCTLLLRADDDHGAVLYPHGNLFLDALCGADVRIVPRAQYQRNLKTLFAKLEEECLLRGEVPYSIPTGGSNGMGLWGYIEAAQELLEDFKRLNILHPLVVCAAGSGGTAGGLALGFALLQTDVPLLAFAVCDSKAYFEQKIRNDVSEWCLQMGRDRKEILAALKFQINDDYIGPGYGLSYPALKQSIMRLAKSSGEVLDPVYTGKAFLGLETEALAGTLSEYSDIVFIHTGGIFGLMARGQEFSDG